MPRLPRATELSYLVKFLLAAGGDHLRLIISSNNDTHVLQSAGQDVGAWGYHHDVGGHCTHLILFRKFVSFKKSHNLEVGI